MGLASLARASGLWEKRNASKNPLAGPLPRREREAEGLHWPVQWHARPTLSLFGVVMHLHRPVQVLLGCTREPNTHQLGWRVPRCNGHTRCIENIFTP